MRKFRHNKTGKEYELIQENCLKITCDDDYDVDRIFPGYNTDKIDNLVLYKDADGPYFVRPTKDFFENFTEIKESRELHFFTNLCNELQTSEWDLETMQTDFVSTRNAIYETDEKIVKTTMLSFLMNSWDLIDDGWRIFIHNDNAVIEVRKGMVSPDGKEIRRGHSIHRLLVAGALGEIK